MENNSLPNGFISIDDAIKLIESDTRDDAKVDVQYMVKHIDWVERAHNFRIPLLKHSADKRTIEKVGEKYVYVSSVFEQELLKKTIQDHYKLLAGKEYVKELTRAISTVSDEETAGGVKPRRTKSIAKEGEVIGTSNSAVKSVASGAGV